MKCEICGREYPSRFYFANDRECNECYKRRHPDAVQTEYGAASIHEIAGKQLSCPHCGHDQFWRRSTLMNTRGLSFFGLEWANKEAENYVCDRCGYVFWFMQKHP